MLPSDNRLKGHRLIDKVKSEGKIYQSNHFAVISLKQEKKSHSRFAFIISSKISKAAVHRNRIKRALGEVVRQNMSLFPKGYDMVFLVKKSILKKTTEEIMQQVKLFIKKTDVTK